MPLVLIQLLRLTGLVFCLLQTTALWSATRSIRDSGGGTSEILVSLTGNSIPLILGLMLVLVSLHLQILFREMEPRGGFTIVPLFYRFTRPLILFIAIAYLAMIPAQLVSAANLRDDGIRRLNTQTDRQKNFLTRISDEGNGANGVEKAAQLLEQYQAAYNITINRRPRTINELNYVINEARKGVDLDYFRKIRSADGNLSKTTTNVISSSILFALLILFYWYHWPKMPKF